MYFESYLDSSTEINFIFILCTDSDSASAFGSAAAAGDAAIVRVVVVVEQNCEMRKPKHSTMYILLTFYNTQIRLKVLIFQHVLIPFHSIRFFYSFAFFFLPPLSRSLAHTRLASALLPQREEFFPYRALHREFELFLLFGHNFIQFSFEFHPSHLYIRALALALVYPLLIACLHYLTHFISNGILQSCCSSSTTTTRVKKREHDSISFSRIFIALYLSPLSSLISIWASAHFINSVQRTRKSDPLQVEISVPESPNAFKENCSSARAKEREKIIRIFIAWRVKVCTANGH